MLIAGNGANELLHDATYSASARDQALDTLFNRISCYGLQEFFDESLMVFSSATQLEDFHYTLQMKNLAKPRCFHFEQRHIERITELNRVDIEVYRAAKEKFMSLLASNAFDHGKLRRFRLINETVVVRRNNCRTIVCNCYETDSFITYPDLFLPSRRFALLHHILQPGNLLREKPLGVLRPHIQRPLQRRMVLAATTCPAPRRSPPLPWPSHSAAPWYRRA